MALNINDPENAQLFTQKMGISPVVFAANIINQTTQTNNFINSGVVMEDPNVSPLLLQAGNTVVLPYFNDLYGAPQDWNDDDDIDSSDFTAGTEKHVKLYQAKSFGFTDLARLTQTGDPLAAIQSRYSNYWRRNDEQIVLDLLQGVMANDKIKQYKMYDKDQTTSFNVASFEKSISLLADYQDDTVNTIAVHPAVYAQMKSQNYINLTGNDTPENRAATPFGTYNGMNIIVDRRLPIDANGVATSYIFNQGAVMYSTAFPTNGGYEFQRYPEKRGGTNEIISKRVYTAHVHGTTVADSYAPMNGGNHFTQADLANPAMWDFVWDPLKIQIVAYKSQVGDGFASQFWDDEAQNDSLVSAAAANGKSTRSSSSASGSSSASTSTSSSSTKS